MKDGALRRRRLCLHGRRNAGNGRNILQLYTDEKNNLLGRSEIRPNAEEVVARCAARIVEMLSVSAVCFPWRGARRRETDAAAETGDVPCRCNTHAQHDAFRTSCSTMGSRAATLLIPAGGCWRANRGARGGPAVGHSGPAACSPTAAIRQKSGGDGARCSHLPREAYDFGCIHYRRTLWMQ